MVACEANATKMQMTVRFSRWELEEWIKPMRFLQNAIIDSAKKTQNKTATSDKSHPMGL